MISPYLYFEGSVHYGSNLLVINKLSFSFFNVSKVSYPIERCTYVNRINRDDWVRDNPIYWQGYQTSLSMHCLILNNGLRSPIYVKLSSIINRLKTDFK